MLSVSRSGGGDDAFAADVTKPEDAPTIVAACVERFGTVDVLVNNAGTSFVRSLEELSDEDWQSQWEPLWTDPGGLADQAAASRDEALAAQAGKIPLGRFASPEEIAAAIVFLCSQRASAVTGAAWSADGGTFASII